MKSQWYLGTTAMQSMLSNSSSTWIRPHSSAVLAGARPDTYQHPCQFCSTPTHLHTQTSVNVYAHIHIRECVLVCVWRVRVRYFAFPKEAFWNEFLEISVLIIHNKESVFMCLRVFACVCVCLRVYYLDWLRRLQSAYRAGPRIMVRKCQPYPDLQEFGCVLMKNPENAISFDFYVTPCCCVWSKHPEIAILLDFYLIHVCERGSEKWEKRQVSVCVHMGGCAIHEHYVASKLFCIVFLQEFNQASISLSIFAFIYKIRKFIVVSVRLWYTTRYCVVASTIYIFGFVYSHMCVHACL